LAYLLVVGLNIYFFYRKWRLKVDHQAFQVKSGVVADYNTLMKIYKVQNVELKQNIYQRRRDLASLELHTASGSVKIPYIPLEKAEAIRDYVLYKVESSRERWM